MSFSSIESIEERAQPVAWRVDPWRREVANMSRSKFYEERKAGRIETRKMGAATLVVTSPRQYVDALPVEAA
jgi:hypothetical protein